jgi:hypothetical protein
LADDDTALSRTASADRDKAEVRIWLPMKRVAVLDALAAQRGTNRTALVMKFVDEAIERVVYEASVLIAMDRGNPTFADSDDVAASAMPNGRS